MANRLARETSPYLIQHSENPVDWYPWGEEAMGRAREQDRPILLSVGYSACHWCHVMERESFEDPETAAYMNEHFVNVKVDREERPDVDAIYMEAVQAISGQGGWPMTVFLDPDGVPFYGGTYFPPDESRGMPSFRMVMEAVVDAFERKRDEIRERAGETRSRLGAIGAIEPAAEPPEAEMLEQAVERLLTSADRERGGFGGAPKFPPASALELLLARGSAAPDDAGPAREAVERTLDAMMAGGIYDQLGGGFARYSVDAAWLVPHFEKMLYDNALLARAYLHGWQAFGHERYRRVAEETLDWMLREMRGPEGGFYSALDADSEGEEGRFYVWTPAQVREALAAAGLPRRRRRGRHRATTASPSAATSRAPTSSTCRAAPRGGLVPHGRKAAASELDEARRASTRRAPKRVWPGLDDKRLASWNALAIAALADAGAALGREDHLDAAREAAGFVLGSMRDEDGRLLRTYKDGRAHLNAYLEDHAFLLEALLTLYEATFEQRWFDEARALAETMIERFGDSERGGFFSTSSDHEELIARRKEIGDHPIPSGNSAAALGLLRLAALTGERAYERQAEGVLRLFARPAAGHPEAFAHLLRALDFHLAPTREVALVGEDLAALAAVVRDELRPHLVLAGGAEGTSSPPLLADRPTVEGRPTAYVCEHFTCQAPVTDPQQLEEALDAPFTTSENGQEVLDLVRRHLDPVLVPFLALDLDEAPEGVLAQGAQHELRVGGDLDRLAERRRQLLDPLVGELLGREVVEVLLHRLRQLVALFDALEARLQHAREAEVGVAGRVRTAQLGPGRALLAGVVERHADQRRAVAARPGEVDRRLVAGHQPLVGVDPLREERRDLARVLELAGDEGLGGRREEVLVVGVEEGVLAAFREATGGRACRSRSRRRAASA